MNTKVLITTKNTEWGVIVNPITTNNYRHILSFETPELKTQYIETVLMNGETLETAFNRISETNNVFQTDNSGVFRINVNEYENILTLEELLNADFAIIREYNEQDVTKFKDFYVTLSSSLKPNKNVIEYQFEIDEFFQNDITDLIKGEVRVERSHVDNYVWNEEVSTADPIIDSESVLTLPESFDGSIDDNLFLPNEIEEIEFSYDNFTGQYEYNSDISELSSEEQYDLIGRTLVNYHWMIMYYNIDELNDFIDDPIKSVIGSEINGVKYPYYIYVAPVVSEDDIKVYFKRESINGAPSIPDIPFDSKYLYDLLYDDSNIIKNASTIIKSPLLFNEIFPTFSYIKLERDGTNYKIIMYVNDGLDANPDSSRYWTIEKDTTGERFDIILREDYTRYLVRIWKLNQKFESNEYRLKLGDIPEFNIEDTLNNELKIKYSMYNKFSLKGTNENEFHVNREYLPERLKFRSEFYFTPELWVNNYFISHIISDDINNTIYTKDNSFNMFLNDVGNYFLPDSKDLFNEFITTNKSSLTSSYISGIGKGVVGAGLITAGVLGGSVFGVLGGVSLEMNAATNILNNIASVKDVKRTPNKPSPPSILLEIFTIRKLGLKIAEYKLIPEIEKLIHQFFREFGYNRNGELVDLEIENIFKSRKFYNYVRIEETFENIKMKLSAKRKQIINDSLKNGITIWNVRDLDSFKGIKNYNVNNYEMSIANKILEMKK